MGVLTAAGFASGFQNGFKKGTNDAMKMCIDKPVDCKIIYEYKKTNQK